MGYNHRLTWFNTKWVLHMNISKTTAKFRIYQNGQLDIFGLIYTALFQGISILKMNLFLEM